jgi:phage baseplate assembly protein W
MSQSLYKRTKVATKKKKVNAPIKSKIYRGISTINTDNKEFNLYDISLVKQDILNAFHIRKGEKLENPTVGTIIWDMLFEPLTPKTKQMIADDVTAILKNEPRIRVSRISLSSLASGIQIECTITYLPHNITENLQLRFDRENNILS